MKKISFITVTASRLSKIMNRKIVSAEYGRIGKIISVYGKLNVDSVLNFLEQDNFYLNLVEFNLGIFQEMTKQVHNGGSPSLSIGAIINKNLRTTKDESIRTQERGKELLATLISTNGSN